MYLNEKKKTIAHVVCSFPPNKDGTGNSAYEITKNLAQKGYDITVFTPHRVSGIGYPMSDGFEVKRLKPLFKIGNAAFLPQLIWYLRKFDIVHLHYPFYGAAEFIILAKILNPKIKLIIHYHQDAVGNDFKKLIFKSYQWLILPILVRLAHYITCATLSYIKQSELGGYYKKHPEKFRQTYFGVNYKQCKNHIIPHRGKSKCKINNSKIILFVGGLDRPHYFKGVDILLNAVKQLKVDSWKLQIVGDGDLRPGYANLAKELGIAEKVKFWGKMDDKKLIMCYDNCDILVLPSINKGEAFGLVLLEAMACGKPVIASRLPGVDSVFIDRQEGFFVTPGDANDLTEKIDFLLKNNKLATEMGELGRKLVQEKYNWDKVVERIEEVYSAHNMEHITHNKI